MPRRLIPAALVLVFALAAGYFWFKPAPSVAPATPPPDPRVEYAGPFENVRPTVRYVADAACAECHADIAGSYATHPMARSVVPVADAPAPPSGPGERNPFRAFGAELSIEAEGKTYRHRVTVPGPDGRPAAEVVHAVSHVVGSGARGHSYLAARAGFLFQTPVSWYTQKHIWDTSPGFGPGQLAGRAVLNDCLFCHAGRTNPVPGTVNGYADPPFAAHAIGCQRCHGPGELHVARPGAAKPDPTVVNPKHLDREIRNAVCEQCHLDGETRVARRGRELAEFRPGLPLDQFLQAFEHAAEGRDRNAVGHVEQMRQSACYQAGSLGCTSCHDPHAPVRPADRVAFYRGRCVTCHDRRGCSVPVAERTKKSPADSCIDCHMPRYSASDIPHTAATDHRVPRVAGRPRKATPPPANGLPVVPFYPPRPGEDTAEAERDLCVALVQLAQVGDPAALKAVRRALPGLDAAVRRHPGDLPAAEARAAALAADSRLPESLAAYSEVLARDPRRETALAGAAAVAAAARRVEDAIGYWEQVVAVNPQSADARQGLVDLHMKREALAAARPHADAWVRLDPFRPEARAARVACLLGLGEKDEARAEFARLESLAPPNLREYRIRFERKLK